MQDRYAGDIGDYIKIGLLRAISKRRRLGIVWYRYPDESHNEDGRHISYLEQPKKYESVDPELFEHLKSVVKNDRSIDSLSPMLGGATCFDESVDFRSKPIPDRRQWRKEWFAKAKECVSDCDLIFADPDNGIIDDDDRRKGSAKFGKQIALQEVKALADGRCAVIYHHNTRRKGGHAGEVAHWITQIDRTTMAIRARAFSARTFFVVNPDDEIRNNVIKYCETWGHLKIHLH
ncbi:MAG: hypothetical protein ABJQ70_16455 [Roseobacter sp.]